MEGSITVFGENGTVKIGGQYLNVLEYQNIKDYKIENLPESGPANDYGSYQGSMSNHDKVYENVIDVLTNGGTITTNFMDGLKTVQIIEKIYNAARINSNQDYSLNEISLDTKITDVTTERIVAQILQSVKMNLTHESIFEALTKGKTIDSNFVDDLDIVQKIEQLFNSEKIKNINA